MPYLPTPQAYLEQSALLLQAYPDAVRAIHESDESGCKPTSTKYLMIIPRITTKYTFPASKPKTQKATTQPQPESQTTAPPTEEKPRIATLTLKTFHAGSGICLKYRTNKGAEVGRLITSLGKLAAGADVEALGLGGAGAVPAGAGAGDAEMVDAPPSLIPAGAGEGGNEGPGKGGKGKKKGGKGRR
ncbi:SRP9/SRP21 family protein [Aspergillus homomorphus CBS 101889]|uniref:SRP9 domain-containing protein n=1 Tax=Aspergillus homomorphus (strain CBS 101889) TaxID=1450537 RepID=A0A395I516_ASPHC|nr:hypothetical protein BO97DRAFT_441649 [Aspergillus homomorphus CBS 101889]RAL14663.1 hypothetical protein BO97DRAFT_441649 [Aspergillus homomorphus CBS 101889]